MDSDKAVIKVNDYTYSLVEPPPAISPIVIKAKDNMLGHIDLEQFVDDLGRLGNCVRIAYHGVAGDAELQIKIQGIGYDVTKLCDKSALTVSHFKKASSTIVLTLQATYQYLLDSLEDMAIETLADVAETAKGMADAASNLRTEFNKQSEAVIAAVKDLQQKKQSKEEDNIEIAKEITKIEGKIKKLESTRKVTQELAEKAETLYYDAKQKEEIALNQPDEVVVGTELVEECSSCFFGLYTSKKVEERVITKPTHWREKAQFANKEKMLHLQEMYKQHEIRSEVMANLEEYANSLKNVKGEKSFIQAAVQALLHAIGALRSLAAIMLQATQFWSQMQHHCEELAKDKIKVEIERALKLPEERRLRVWTSNAFKTKAIHYYAGWVALDYVCTIYMDRIKLTRRELYTYIQETLATDEAHKIVPVLAKEFGINLKKEQAAIEEKKKKQQAEIDNLREKMAKCGQVEPL